MFVFLMFSLITSNITQSQTTKVVYPIFSISPMAGVQFPIGTLNNQYKPSFQGGLDLNLKINRETSFFLCGGWANMPVKEEFAGPDASIINITAGPRYIFTSKNIKAQIFVEAGVGVYLFSSKDYTPIGTPSVTIPGTSTTNFGVNIGPGAIIPLGTSIDLIMKTKLNYMFQEGGANSYIGILMGLDFKL